jgi:hypothetical protein
MTYRQLSSSEGDIMNRTSQKTSDAPHEHLLQYAQTVAAMHKALQRIFANEKAISESLTRSAAALRSISANSQYKQEQCSLR